MNPTTEDEKKKPIIPAPVPADTQTAEVVPPVQTASQQATNNQTPQVTQQTAGNDTVTVPVGRHSTRFSATIPNMLGDRMTAANARMDAATQQYQFAAERYQDGTRNPLADIVLAKQKPVRNVDEETRLRQNAKLHALNNIVSLIGKGVAATGGIRPTLPDNRPIYDIQNRLQRLDDIYRQEGMRYDQNSLMSALRKDQTTQAGAQAEMSAAAAARKAAQDEINRIGDSVLKWGMSEEDRAFKAAQQKDKQVFDAQQNANRNRTTLAAASIRSKGKTGSGKEDKPLYRVNLRGNPVDVTTELRADVLNWGKQNGFETDVNAVGNILGTKSLQEQQLVATILPAYEKYIAQQDALYGPLIVELKKEKGSDRLTPEQVKIILSAAYQRDFDTNQKPINDFTAALQRHGIRVE